MRLLLVEDDAALRDVLSKRLIQEGYAVDACGDGNEGLEYALSAPYDGIILDIMLPGIDGLTLLTHLRARHVDCGVLLLTARDAVDDRVRGLDCGADDYLTKPFAYEELSARLRAMLRRHAPSRSPVLRVGDLELDTVSRAVHRGKRAVSLTAKEYALLEYLMRNAGQVLTPGQIYDHVWDYQGTFDSNLVPVYIGYLRSKIDKGEDTPYIRTVRGFGYVLRDDKNEA
ncbi:MAG: response regulator transcription factor [Eubacteriales bacterium]|nr:response regulator transcription factor [Eubacteriales bacterium]